MSPPLGVVVGCSGASAEVPEHGAGAGLGRQAREAGSRPGHRAAPDGAPAWRRRARPPRGYAAPVSRFTNRPNCIRLVASSCIETSTRSVRPPRLQPRVDRAVPLHQLAQRRPPRPPTPVLRPLAPARPQPRRRQPSSDRLGAHAHAKAPLCVLAPQRRSKTGLQRVRRQS